MKSHDYFDIGKIIDEIFDAAEEFSTALKDSMAYPGAKVYSWRFGDERDYYPAYSYPPSNVYVKDDKTMVFEFALAGFHEDDITIEFRGDHLIFSATVSETQESEESVKYFKRRLKLKDIPEQKYYVPADKYDQQATEAVFKNGILIVSVPPRDVVQAAEGVKVNIKTEEPERSKSSGGSTASNSKKGKEGN